MNTAVQSLPHADLTWTPELVQEFWQYYASHRQVDYFTDLFGAQVIEQTKGYYQPSAIVCDYGCGAGFLLEHILKSHRASGCDFTPKNIEATRDRIGGHPNLLELFSVADAMHVNGTFDVIYVVETIEHVLEGDLDIFFQTINRLLKPNGVVIATTPNEEDLQANAVYCPCCKHSFHRWQHIRSFDSIRIQSFMSKGGFIATKVFATDFAAVKWWPRFKAAARPILGKKNPHLVYIGYKPS
jgi:2-polyprenyl-3-methyl-5-hydroxy-6-metoxy-1,4-benzoquinol methylase